jgi:hypothetical protein
LRGVVAGGFCGDRRVGLTGEEEEDDGATGMSAYSA